VDDCKPLSGGKDAAVRMWDAGSAGGGPGVLVAEQAGGLHPSNFQLNLSRP
jgi:hypothetical protein